MKKLIQILTTVIIALCITSCFKLSTQELAKEIKQSIQEELTKNETDLTVTSINLVHESGNKYSGVATIEDETGDSDDFKVEVIYDGNNYQWEIPDFYQQLFMKGFIQGLMEE